MGTTPILVNIHGGLALSSPEAGVLFDLDNTGSKRWSWPTGYDGWLVWDRNGNGVIDNGRELFGNTTLLPDGSTARNGFQALAQMDANNDGLVDERDPGFNDLRVWVDTVRDGYSAADELLTLAEVGVTALAVGPKLAKRRDRWANTYRWRAPVYFVDGRTRFAYDVILSTSARTPVAAACKPADSEIRWSEER